MVNVVKLILICQIKDELIPQLIPLMWRLSVIICFFIILVLVEIFYYTEYSIDLSEDGGVILIVNYKW